MSDPSATDPKVPHQMTNLEIAPPELVELTQALTDHLLATIESKPSSSDPSMPRR